MGRKFGPAFSQVNQEKELQVGEFKSSSSNFSAEVNSYQTKTEFQNRVCRYLNRILNGDCAACLPVKPETENDVEFDNWAKAIFTRIRQSGIDC
jgi:hypothetical protein